MSSDEQWYLGGGTGRVCLNTEETLVIPSKGSNCGICYTQGDSSGGNVIRYHKGIYMSSWARNP